MSVLLHREPSVLKLPNVAVPSPILQMENVCKGYGSGVTRNEVLSNINLDIREGEFLAVVGFSGSGKTTFTQLAAGLIQPDQGTITMDGQLITGPSADRGLVFQNYSLLPWLTVRGNIALSVNTVFRNWSRAERRDHVERFIEMVGLSHAAHRRPHELSGGMRQRTSLARTLAMKPKMLLLDEPLSALDALTRSQLGDEILKIWQEERQTCLMITNDVDEAILVADRIVPLTPGPEATLGPIFDVDIERPRNRAELNDSEHFKSLRNAVTNYLVDVRQQARDKEMAASKHLSFRLPDIRPQDLTRKGRIIG
ncbi:ABC transporter ATP-binding protein [Allorhodopirellula heiligendammensis]|uniref:Bicarbonate transport ATP-binding protein CmpC n=1 Tax=Allorhodopirellula heiligendammensis TaxID=2714739 RepID=A0A5C6C2C6_9BACT|nr:ABC transporter ATP-binding protein [Allorhodopirellula heiligendammensis]TWU18147.1 Bicarbonate transport ATP-binding protein CmpC [Allorhodopirellula heiligendammensis]